MTRQVVRVIADIISVIVAADVDSFIVLRAVVEWDSIAVAILESFIVHRSVVEGDSVAVFITKSDLQEAVTYPTV